MATHPLLDALNLYPEELESLLAKGPTIKAQVEALA
jgi:hypothetical protein